MQYSKNSPISTTHLSQPPSDLRFAKKFTYLNHSPISTTGQKFVKNSPFSTTPIEKTKIQLTQPPPHRRDIAWSETGKCEKFLLFSARKKVVSDLEIIFFRLRRLISINNIFWNYIMTRWPQAHPVDRESARTCKVIGNLLPKKSPNSFEKKIT